MYGQLWFQFFQLISINSVRNRKDNGSNNLSINFLNTEYKMKKIVKKIYIKRATHVQLKL
jgi:hypothetical protein